MLRWFNWFALSSVCLLQAPCTYGGHGISIIPNNILGNPFTGLLYAVTKDLF